MPKQLKGKPPTNVSIIVSPLLVIVGDWIGYGPEGTTNGNAGIIPAGAGSGAGTGTTTGAGRFKKKCLHW